MLKSYDPEKAFGKIWYIDGDDVSDYLVKIEIVSIEKEDI